MADGEIDDGLDGEIVELQPGDEGYDEARRQEAIAKGWKPLDQYSGPPSRWRDYDEFLRIGEADNRILREENRRLATKVGRLENQVGGLIKTGEEQIAALKELRVLAQRSDQRGYERARAELMQQRRDAVESGNTELFDQLDEQVRSLDKGFAEKPPEPERAAPPPPPPPQIDPAVIAFTDENPWFRSDPKLNAAMINYCGIVDKKHPGWSLEDRLAEAKRRVMEEFPEAFSMAPRRDDPDDDTGEPAPRPRRASAVARPSAPAARPRNREPQGFDQITDPIERAQARQAYESIKKWDPDYSEAEYLAVYFEPKADELELRRQRSAAR